MRGGLEGEYIASEWPKEFRMRRFITCNCNAKCMWSDHVGVPKCHCAVVEPSSGVTRCDGAGWHSHGLNSVSLVLLRY
jgi:hypothetical protein